MIYHRNPPRDLGSWDKRINFLMAFIFILALLVLYKLFQHGVLENKKFVALAEKQHTAVVYLEPKRGEIYAKDFSSGELFPLATNIEKYSINIIPKNVKDKLDTAKKLAKILDIKDTEIFDKINNDKLYIPPVKTKVEKDVANKVLDLNLAGVVLTLENVRYYPEDNLAGQVLGFVNNEKKGNYGVEGYYDNILRGEGGEVVAEKDAWGRYIELGTTQNMRDGSNLVLSIDHNVQYTVEQKLQEAKDKYQADNGSIIVMNPKTGAIIAIAGNPNFNPNKFSDVKKEEQNVFVDPAISDTWEPGSIIKPVTMSGAIDNGKVNPDTEGVFSNYTVVQGYEIHTAQDKAFGRETMTQVLENSDNVAMVWVAEMLGNDLMYKNLEKFGLTQKTGIDLEGETFGSIPLLKSWHDISRATISFGQGMSLTPLQMLLAYSVIANGGKMVKPYVVEKIVEPDNKEIKTESKIIGDVISKDTADKVTGMLVSVVERGHGKKAQVPGYSVAGKTGTAQIPKSGGGYYEDQHTGSFVGFLPADNPQFAMIVRLENPKNVDWAESSAAPTFGEIAQWLVNYYQIPPTK